jgi:hypothetical protein
MKILLDECLPVDFRHSFSRHEAHTVQRTGFKSRQNGDLLRAAEAAGYDVLLTVDQGLPYQQNLDVRHLSVLSISSRTNQLADLIPLVDEILKVLTEIGPGQVVRVR